MFRRVGSRCLCAAAAKSHDPFKSRLVAAAGAAVSSRGINLSTVSDAAASMTTAKDEGKSPAEVLREFLDSRPKTYKAPESDTDAMTTFRDSRGKTGLGGTKVTAEMPLSEAVKVLDAGDADKWRRQCIFQSQWRGMSELDLILGAFAKKLFQTPYEASGVVETVTEALVQDLRDYDAILREFDNDLNKWLIEAKEVPSRMDENRLWPTLVEFVEKNKDQIVKYR